MAREDAELGRLIATGGPEATAEGLRGVVARRSQQRARRRRTGGAGALVVVALIATTVIVSQLGSGRGQIAPHVAAPLGGTLLWRAAPAAGTSVLPSASSVASRSAASAASVAPACPVAVGPSCVEASGRALFSRTVGDVEITATLIAIAGGAPLPLSPGHAAPSSRAPSGETPTFSCTTASELSVVARVAKRTSAGPLLPLAALLLPSVVGSSAAIQAIATDRVTTSTGQGLVIALRTATSVSATAVRFGDGHRDEMATVDGWSVLVDPGGTSSSARIGQVLALSTSGVPLGTEALVRSEGIALPEFCIGERSNSAPAPVGKAAG